MKASPGSTSPPGSRTNGTRSRSTPTTTPSRSGISSRSSARAAPSRLRSDRSRRPGLRRPRRDRSDGRMLLNDKVVIVSGVGPGLGQANAHALAREGATVVLAARNADYLAQVQAEIEGRGGRALAVPTNLVDPEQVGGLVERTVGEFGRLDGLVNNAFRMDTFEPYEAVDLVKW